MASDVCNLPVGPDFVVSSHRHSDLPTPFQPCHLKPEEQEYHYMITD